MYSINVKKYITNDGTIQTTIVFDKLLLIKKVNIQT